MKPWEHWGPGAVVRWADGLWIIVEIGPSKSYLVSLTCPRLSARPSDTWPKDEQELDEDTDEVKITRGQRIDTIEFVAPTVKEYLLKILHAPFSELLK